MNEQRREIRVNMERSIVVKLSSGQVIRARLVNLSTGGLALRYPAPAEIGAQLDLQFQLPGSETPATLSIKGIVRHCHVHREDFITGIQFVELDEEVKIIISRFIESKISTHTNGVLVSHRHR